MTIPGERPGWQADGACRDYPPEWWFPGRGGDAKRAKAICADCPVRQECAEYAFAEGIHHGIWGGLSERERRKIRQQRRSAA